MYLVFTRMPCESNRRRLRSLLLCLCEVFRAPVNLLKLILHRRSGPRSVLDLKNNYQIVSTNRTGVDVKSCNIRPPHRKFFVTVEIMHAPSGSQVTSGHRVIVRFYGSAVHSYDLGALSAQSVFQQLCKKAVQISLNDPCCCGNKTPVSRPVS